MMCGCLCGCLCGCGGRGACMCACMRVSVSCWCNGFAQSISKSKHCGFDLHRVWSHSSPSLFPGGNQQPNVYV